MDTTEQNIVISKFAHQFADYYNNHAPQYEYYDIGGCDVKSLTTNGLFALVVNGTYNQQHNLVDSKPPARPPNVLATEYRNVDGIIKLCYADAFHSMTIPSFAIEFIDHVELLFCATNDTIHESLFWQVTHDDKYEVIASVPPNAVIKFYNAPILRPKMFAVRVIFKEYGTLPMSVGLKYLMLSVPKLNDIMMEFMK
jgi:hypothetical protein